MRSATVVAKRILLCYPAVALMLVQYSHGWIIHPSSLSITDSYTRRVIVAPRRISRPTCSAVHHESSRPFERSSLSAAAAAASPSWGGRGRREGGSNKKSTKTNADNAPAAVTSAMRKEISSSGSTLLEDSVGRVNRDLAERIWNWEQERRDSSRLPRLEYSIRSGLKLVSKLASQVRQTSVIAHRVTDPGDLVQEGLVALLDALGSYAGSDPSEFETFASERIRASLTRSLQQHDTTSPSRTLSEATANAESVINVVPRRSLPRSVHKTLQRAQQAVRELSGPKTLSRIASAMGMTADRLRDCIELAWSVHRAKRPNADSSTTRSDPPPSLRTMLSVESTVEISNPQLQDSVEYRDQDEWELWQGLLLDDGRGAIRRDELVEDFVDETLHDEGDDDSWIRQQQNAGRLQDLIPDDRSASVDDVALVELIRGDLSTFLSDTLTEQEQEIVRMAFGLTDGGEPPAAQSRIAKVLGLDKGAVSKALAQAIDKLRVAYRTRYVEPYSADNDDLIDSV